MQKKYPLNALIVCKDFRVFCIPAGQADDFDAAELETIRHNEGEPYMAHDEKVLLAIRKHQERIDKTRVVMKPWQNKPPNIGRIY